MRKISASYIISPEIKALKYGILEFDSHGTILSLSDTGGVMYEIENLEFYSGVLIPAFINLYAEPVTNQYLMYAKSRGDICIPDTVNILKNFDDLSAEHLNTQNKDVIYSSDFLKLGFNNVHLLQTCKLTEFVIDKLILQIEINEKSRLKTILDLLKVIIHYQPEISFFQLLQICLVNACKVLNDAAQYGTFTDGKIPGIILLENFDFTTFNIKQNTVIKLFA